MVVTISSWCVFWRDFSIRLNVMSEPTRGTEAACIQQLIAVCFQHKSFFAVGASPRAVQIVFH